MSTKPLRRLLLLLLATLLVSIQFAPQAHALIPEQKKLLNDTVYWFNYKAEEAAVCAAAGLSGGGPANIAVGKDFVLGTAPAERRINLVRALMRDFGLNAEQGSGIVGNFMIESGGEQLPPDVNEGGQAGPPAFRGGYGWAQWTGPRQREFINYAVANGYMANNTVRATDAANYAYLTHELTTGYKSTITQIKTKSLPEDAAISFEATFEKAGKPVLDKRAAAARRVFIEVSGGSGGSPTSPSPIPAGAGCIPTNGGATIVGANAFPLNTTQTKINSQNPGLFARGTTGKGGHPYTAYDILADPGTEVVAFLSGTVSSISTDRCPGRLISVFNQESNLTISYLHLDLNQSTHVADKSTVTVGQKIGIVGPAAAGCGTPHLHIDAARGPNRPGCSRLKCPASNASQFVDIGPQLFTTYEALQKGNTGTPTL